MGHNGEQLSQLQLYIDRLQAELQQITANIKQQALEYQQLLDIKMRLELEIAEYRRLLGGEEQGWGFGFGFLWMKIWTDKILFVDIKWKSTKLVFVLTLMYARKDRPFILCTVHSYSVHETDTSRITTVSKMVTQTVMEEKEVTQNIQEVEEGKLKFHTLHIVYLYIVCMTLLYASV